MSHSPGPQSDRQNSPPEVTDIILSNLSDLIQVVQTCLDQHSGMQSTEIKDAVKNLTSTYQSMFVCVYVCGVPGWPSSLGHWLMTLGVWVQGLVGGSIRVYSSYYSHG